jgi:RNA recognition motif-containing protein
VKVVRDDKTGQSLTYGFVHFEVLENAAAAIACEHGSEWSGKKIRVSVARQKKDAGYCKILISKIDPSVTEATLRTLFNEVKILVLHLS